MSVTSRASWVFAALLLAACSASEPARPPNLVLIGADDLGFSEMGFMGSEYVETPNLDRLAEEGTVFTGGQHVASLCRPSLRALLTGLEPLQWKQRATGLAPGQEMRRLQTLPRMLGRAGYTSFQAGKLWEAGYDVAGFTSGMNPPGVTSLRGGQGAALGRDSIEPALEFLEANADRPFFLWFFPKLPHTPHDAGPGYRRRYEGRGLSEAAAAYYANVTRFDDVVGRLLTRLDELDLTRRTLVVFLTDNGWELPAVGRKPRGKKTLHEVGFRTPIVFRLPGRIEAGRRVEHVVSTIDLFPTLLAYAGLEAPEDRAGVDLGPVLRGGTEAPRAAVIGWMEDLHTNGPQGLLPGAGFFLRDRDWRYVWYPHPDRDELYAIRTDPLETSDVSAEHPALVGAFRQRIRAWEAAMRGAASSRRGS